MRHISINIQVDNSAFESDQVGNEVARILREYASDCEIIGGNLWLGFQTKDRYIYKMDINGNKVARLSFSWN